MIEYTSRRCYLKRQLILLLILLFGIRFSLSIGKDLCPSKFRSELHTQQCVKNFHEIWNKNEFFWDLLFQVLLKWIRILHINIHVRKIVELVKKSSSPWNRAKNEGWITRESISYEDAKKRRRNKDDRCKTCADRSIVILNSPFNVNDHKACPIQRTSALLVHELHNSLTEGILTTFWITFYRTIFDQSLRCE